jgi:hypothetical protein
MAGGAVVPWTDEERVQLRRLRENGLTLGQIAALMGRSKDSVHRQTRYLGLPKPDRVPAAPVVAVSREAPLRSPKVTLPPLPSLVQHD